MADFDPALAAVLDEVLPLDGDRGDWERVLADATQAAPRRRRIVGRFSRRRLVVVVAAAVVAALIPLVAVAADQGWWFFSSSGVKAPPATSDVVVVKRGSWHGTPWALAAYRTKRQGLCIGFTPNPPAGPAPSPTVWDQAMFGCGAAVRGTPGLPPTKTVHQLAFYSSVDSNSTAIEGATAADVTQVELLHADGSITKVPTIAAPPDLHTGVRFFVAVFGPADAIRAITAIGKSGNVLETATLRTLPAQTRTNPNSKTYITQWGS